MQLVAEDQHVCTLLIQGASTYLENYIHKYILVYNVVWKPNNFRNKTELVSALFAIYVSLACWH